MLTIKVPDLGEGVAEVELVVWRVQPGDRVVEDQVLVDVMTDKATVEIPSPAAGRVLALGGEVGQMLAVGAGLIRIERDDAGDAVAASGRAPGRDATPEASVEPNPTPPPPPSPGHAGAVETVPPRGPDSAHRPDRLLASPAVRARAWEAGVELKDVPARGPAGRIMQADLDAHLARGTARPVRPTPRAPAPPDTTQTVKIVGLRRRIAQQMQESARRIPHFTYVEEADVSELEALRARLNAGYGAQRGHLTLLSFLVRAIVLAVRDFPQINARFDDAAGVLTQHTAVHVGIATQTEAGLMVPVLRNAQTRDVWANAAEIVRLAEAARSGKAVRDELAGSTITVTSLGRLGGIVSTPVINHPEVAIVGVNAITLRPVIRDGAVVARSMMNLSSSFDHRIVDGAQAAAFVRDVRDLLEHPALLFIEGNGAELPNNTELL